MKIDEQLECWTLCAIKWRHVPGGRKDDIRDLWPRLVQKVAEGNTSHELSWKIEVMIKKKKTKTQNKATRYCIYYVRTYCFLFHFATILHLLYSLILGHYAHAWCFHMHFSFRLDFCLYFRLVLLMIMPNIVPAMLRKCVIFVVLKSPSISKSTFRKTCEAEY